MAFFFNFASMTNKPPTVFEGLQEFECEIGLFRQLPGTQEFTSRVRDEAPLELGEKVQLWSIVKSGDGKSNLLPIKKKSNALGRQNSSLTSHKQTSLYFRCKLYQMNFLTLFSPFVQDGGTVASPKWSFKKKIETKKGVITTL